MRRAYVALIVLTTVFSMAWYKIVYYTELAIAHQIIYTHNFWYHGIGPLHDPVT